MAITHEDLKHRAALVKNAQILRESLARLRSLAEYGDMPGGVTGEPGSPLDDRVGEITTLLADISEKWTAKADACIRKAAQVKRAINKVENPDC